MTKLHCVYNSVASLEKNVWCDYRSDTEDMSQPPESFEQQCEAPPCCLLPCLPDTDDASCC
jgi:hypothetical protein